MMLQAWALRVGSLFLFLILGNYAIWTLDFPFDPRDPSTQLAIVVIAVGVVLVALADWVAERIDASNASPRPSQETPSGIQTVLDRAVQVLLWALGGGVAGLVVALAVTSGDSFVRTGIVTMVGIAIGGVLGFLGDARARLLKASAVVIIALAVLITGFALIDLSPLIDDSSLFTVGSLVLGLMGAALLLLISRVGRREGTRFTEALLSRPGGSESTAHHASRWNVHRRVLAPSLCIGLAVIVMVVGGGENFAGSAILFGYSAVTVLLAVLLAELVGYLLYGHFLVPTFATIDSIQDLVVTVLFAVGIAWAVQQFVAKPYRVPSGSMESTIAIGERIIAARLTMRFQDPSRNQIIVFHPNGVGADVYDTDTASSETFVKRLIGMPGETIGAVGGKVYVCSGEGPTEGGSVTSTPGCDFLDQPFVSSAQDDFGPTKIPEGRYFMMGDNRSNSDDSRNWGPIAQHQMIGPALLTYWPITRIGLTGAKPLLSGAPSPVATLPGGWRLVLSAVFSILAFTFLLLPAAVTARQRRSH